jgi:hypothetical protein
MIFQWCRKLVRVAFTREPCRRVRRVDAQNLTVAYVWYLATDAMPSCGGRPANPQRATMANNSDDQPNADVIASARGRRGISVHGRRAGPRKGLRLASPLRSFRAA